MHDRHALPPRTDNNPPEPIAAEPTPFERVEKRILDLYEEARQWLDGEPVATQGQADGLAKLKDEIRKAANEAEALRKAEVKPLDDAKAEIQARYAPLIADNKSVRGKAVLAVETVNAALQPYLTKLDQERREAERKAREEAEAAQRAAQEAMQASQDDLAAREEAERLAEEAKRKDIEARKAANAKAHAKGSGRAQGLRTSYRPKIVDYQALARWVWQRRQDALKDWLLETAQKEFRAGNRDLPGVEAVEVKEVV